MSRPGATVRRLVAGEGRLWEILPWMLVVTAAVSPVSAGRALLVGRVDPWGGLQLFLATVGERMGGPLLGCAAGALLLHLLSRRTVRFDAALDTCAFLLLPFLALGALGAILSGFGLDLWFMPHHRPQGPPEILAVRLLVAFGPSLALFARAVQVVR